jgi:hypothetical protein
VDRADRAIAKINKALDACTCAECTFWLRFTARYQLLEVLGAACGVDGFKLMLTWTLAYNGGDALQVAREDEAFFAVCSYIVQMAKRHNG